MTVDTEQIFRDLIARQPRVTNAALSATEVEAGGGAVHVGELVDAWLLAGPMVFNGSERADLDALCRQIDVRRKVSTTYATGWKRMDPEAAVPAAVAAGLVAVLLANAGSLHGSTGVRDGGWGLKCANSALKALDLFEDAPLTPELRAWAVEILDAQTASVR